MIIASLCLTVEGPSRDQVVRSLRALTGPTVLERGCMACRVLAEADDPTRLVYVEQWETTEQLVSQLRSKRYRKVLAAMEESVASPEIQFLWISEAKGMEFLQAARLNTAPAEPSSGD